MLEIINKAYRIFSKYKLKEELDLCSHCCTTKDERQKLKTLDLKQIPYELIYIHNTAATSNKPPIEEFKYFLPRYLELISENKFPSHSIELSLKRFKHYELTEFTNEEINLVEEFCKKYFDIILAKYPTPNNEGIDAIIVILHSAKCNIIEILEKWKSDQSISGNKHFTDLVNNGLSKRRNKLNNTFSNNSLDEIIEAWLNDDELYKTKYNLIKYDA